MAKKQMVVYEGTVEGLVSDAWNSLEELANEMREAFDNTPESLQASAVGEARSEAADALEGLTEPNLPEAMGNVAVKFEYKPLNSRYATRAQRRDEATMFLSLAIDALNELELDGDNQQDAAQERDDAVGDIESLRDEADEVNFPGMYG